MNRRRYCRDAEAEAEAQAEWLVASGIRVTHVDSHQHMHLMPGLQDIAVRLSLALGGVTLRVPICPFPNQRPAAYLVNALSRELMRKCERFGVPYHRSVGFEHAGHMTAPTIAMYLDHCQGSAAELMVHPGKPTTDTLRSYGEWSYAWESEYDALIGLSGG